MLPKIDKSNETELFLIKTRISEHNHQKLKAIAKSKGKTMTSIFRTAINQFIEKYNEI